MSLANRIAELERNSCNWKNRVEKDTPTGTTPTLSTVKSLLTTSQSTWNNRVPPKDAHLFTVQGKLDRDEVPHPPVAEPHISEDSSDSESSSSSSSEETLSLSHCYNPNDSHFSSFFTTTTATTPPDPNLDLTSFPTTKPILSTRLLLSSRPRKPAQKKGPRRTAQEKVQTALESTCDYNIKLKPPPLLGETEKKLYRIKGKKKPIPIQIPVERGLISNHDCFVLLVGGGVWCFYGDYCNLRERRVCDEWFEWGRRRGRSFKITHHGPKYDEFLSLVGGTGEIATDPKTSELIGDEGDTLYESLAEKTYRFYYWDGVQWVRKVGGVKWEELRDGGVPHLLDYGTELFYYSTQTTTPLAELTIQETIDLGKYLTYKKVKRDLEPIELWSKFPNGKSSRQKKKTIKTLEKKTIYHSEKRLVEFSTERDFLILEGVEFSSGGVRVMEEDPRQISYKTTTLNKHLIQLSSITPHPTHTFSTTDCYLIHHTYCLTYTTRKLDKSLAASTSSGRTRCTWFLWFGRNCAAMDRGRLSTLFSKGGGWEEVFPEKDPSGEKISIEEGSEPVFFHQLFKGAIYHTTTNPTAVFEKRGGPTTEHFVETNLLHQDTTTVSQTVADGSKILVIPQPTTQIHLYRLCLTPPTGNLSIIHQLDYPLITPIPSNSYLFLETNSNCLILTGDLESRREMIKNVISPDGCDFFVVFSLEDYFSAAWTWVGSFCKRFVLGVEGRMRGEEGDFCLKNEMDLRLFREFFTLDNVGQVLGRGVIEEKLGLTEEEFSLLPKWRRNKLTRQFL